VNKKTKELLEQASQEVGAEIQRVLIAVDGIQEKYGDMDMAADAEQVDNLRTLALYLFYGQHLSPDYMKTISTAVALAYLIGYCAGKQTDPAMQNGDEILRQAFAKEDDNG
jgi:hypothetical protein